MKTTLLIFAVVLSFYCSSQTINIDSSFGENGATINSTGCKSLNIYSVFKAANGDYFSGGLYNLQGYYTQVLLCAYQNNGQLDNSFHTDGVWIDQVPGYLTPVKKIVKFSNGEFATISDFENINLTGNSGIMVYKFTADGVGGDPNFGNYNGGGNGITIDSIANTDFISTSAALQSDGKLVVVGMTFDSLSNTHIKLFRVNTDGTIDNTYGINGLASPQLATSEQVTGIAVQSDNKVLISGSIISNNTSSLLVFRLNTDGSIDSSFGSSGSAMLSPTLSTIQFGDVAWYNSQIYVAGNKFFSGDMYLMRFNTNGTLDQSFGMNGATAIAPANININDFPTIHFNGPKVLLLYRASHPNDSLGITITTVNTANGAIDSSFGTDGTFLYTYRGTQLAPHDLLVDSDKIVVVGEADTMLAGGRVNPMIAAFRFKYNEVVAGIKTVKADPLNWVLFPNPVSSEDKFTVKLNDVTNENTLVRIYNTLLEECFSSVIEPAQGSLQVNIHDRLVPGIYYIELSNSTGRTTGKLVVK